MAKSRNQSPRMFDHLQSLYNQQARQQYLVQQNQKQLYFKLMEAENAQKQQQKSQYEYLNKLQNQRIDEFWKNQQQKRRQVELKRKEMIDEARRVNQRKSQQLSNSQMYNPQPNQFDNYGQYLQSEKQRKKAEKQTYLYQNNYYADLRRLVQKKEKQSDISLYKSKQEEQKMLNMRREQDLKRIRTKHQQDVESYRQLDQILRRKQIEKQLLDDYMVKQGAQQIQNRMMQQSEINEYANKNMKNKFITELKSQLNQGQARQKMQRRSSLEVQRAAIQNRNRYLQELDQHQKAQKINQKKKHLEILKTQLKARSLLPQKQLIEDAGIGSPAHIGKVFNDDRRKQLQWIEKNLFKELSIK